MIKLPRAFLSHSSADKTIVGEVATALGRAAVIYDAFEFSVGDEFKNAIQSGLSKSDIFVLFASRKALESDWVQLEIESASQALIKQALSKVVTFIVDPEMHLDCIPDWMKLTLVEKQDNAGLISKKIRRLINQRLSDRFPIYFVGRRNEVDQALEIISGFTDPNYRPPLLVYGLKGIGRRALVQAIARDNLSYSTTLPVVLRSGDLLAETYVRLSEALSPGGIADIDATLVAESEKPWEAIVSDILTLMRTACDSSTLPIIVDDGAIAQQNGVLRPEFELLYHSISADRNIDAMFVLSRRVYGSGNATLPSIRVPELDHSSTQSLIRIAGRDMGLAFERSDLERVDI